MRLGCAVMKRAEPLVQRHHAVGIVHLEIFVMQVVRVIGGIHRGILADHQPVEPGMSLRRRDAKARGEVDHVDRVRRNDEEDQDGGKIDHMLDRVHRQPRPRPRVGVPVMKLVRDPIERRPVKEAMGKVEPDLVNERHEEEQRDEAERVFRRVDHRRVPVGIGPQQQHLVAGPDRNPAGECPEHVVLGLVVEGETLGVLVGPFAVVFVFGVLLAPDI